MPSGMGSRKVEEKKSADAAQRMKEQVLCSVIDPNAINYKFRRVGSTDDGDEGKKKS